MTALICVMYVLVTLDAAFSGICASSGRNALIRKRGYYLRSMWHGALWGQAAILLGLVLVTVTVQFSPNRLRTTAGASPGRTRRECAAWSLSPVRRGVSSMSVAPS